MIRRLFTSAVLAAVIAALAAGPAQTQPDSTKSAIRSGGSIPTDKPVRRGNLFSAVSFGDSAFGAEWARLGQGPKWGSVQLHLHAPCCLRGAWGLE